MYQLANGIGKARANARGRALSIQSWKITVLSSGETSLARHLANGGIEIQPGQEARFLEIPAEGRAHRSYDTIHGAASQVDFAKALSGAANTFHGTAGPAFVAWILEDPERARRDCAQLMKVFEDLAAGLLGRCEDFIVPRAMGTFALIAAAGELATAAGITGWNRDDAMTAALEAAGLWIDGRLAPGRAAQHASILRTRDFLKAYGTTRFLRVGAAGPVAKLAGWRDGHTFYVLPDVWRGLHAGFDASQAARQRRALLPASARPASGACCCGLPRSPPARWAWQPSCATRRCRAGPVAAGPRDRHEHHDRRRRKRGRPAHEPWWALAARYRAPRASTPGRAGISQSGG